MQTVELGKTGVKVSRMGFGAMGLSAFYEPIPPEENSLKVLDHCIQSGCYFIDTADIYGFGDNELLVGKAIKKWGRDKFFISTKFGIKFDSTRKFLGISGQPEWIREACDNSLKRLGIDCIDLYFMHRLDKNTGIETIMKTMKELVSSKKIKYIGLSEVSAETIRKAHAIHPVTAVQVEYSMWTTDIEENGILDVCKELGISVIAYSPLGRGIFGAKFKSPEDIPANDWRKTNPRFQGENFEKNLKLVKIVEEVAEKHHCKPSQVALAWLLQKGSHVIPIPGTTTLSHLDENFGASKVNLSNEDLKKLDAVKQVSGTRYDSGGMANLDY